MKKQGGIYKILNSINNKCYVGSTKDFIKRKSYHLLHLSRNTHPNKHLQKSYNKYGKEHFSFVIIEVVECEYNLCEREQYYESIEKETYNIREIVESNRGLKHGPLSDEHKLKISIAHKGHLVSKETRDKLSEYNKKNPNLNFIYAQLGRDRPQSEKDDISNTMKSKGIKPSDEVRKLSNIARQKTLIQLSLNNEFIKEWISAREVTKEIGIDWKAISSVCLNKRISVGGFKWKYKNMSKD